MDVQRITDGCCDDSLNIITKRIDALFSKLIDVTQRYVNEIVEMNHRWSVQRITDVCSDKHKILWNVFRESLIPFTLIY